MVGEGAERGSLFIDSVEFQLEEGAVDGSEFLLQYLGIPPPLAFASPDQHFELRVDLWHLNFSFLFHCHQLFPRAKSCRCSCSAAYFLPPPASGTIKTLGLSPAVSFSCLLWLATVVKRNQDNLLPVCHCLKISRRSQNIPSEWQSTFSIKRVIEICRRTRAKSAKNQ